MATITSTPVTANTGGFASQYNSLLTDVSAVNAESITGANAAQASIAFAMIMGA